MNINRHGYKLDEVGIKMKVSLSLKEYKMQKNKIKAKYLYKSEKMQNKIFINII